MRIEDLIYVIIGAVPGALLRYAITSEAFVLEGLPLSVLIVNVVGSFILGLTMTGVTKLGFNAEFVPLIAIGFCGSMTTMSSFAYETVNLLDAAKLALFGLNVILNVGLSIGAIIGGQAVINLIVGGI